MKSSSQSPLRLKKIKPGQRFRFFVFDLDGTLLNSLEDLWTSTNYALRWASLPERSLDEVRTFVGNGVIRLLQKAAGDDVLNSHSDAWFTDFSNVFRQHYLVHGRDATRPYDGIIDMLEKLHSHDCRVAVVSNKFHQATCDLCNSYFGTLVDVAIGEGNGIRRKPHPDGVLEALRQLGATSEEAVYVGDSDVDLATADASGLPCVSVTRGFRSREFLIEHGATYLVDHPQELLKL